MPDETRGMDPGVLWRGQPKESLALNTGKMLSRRAAELSAGSRSEILMSVGAGLLFAGIVAWRFGPAQDRILTIGYATVLGWAAITLYAFRDRIWKRNPPRADAVAAPGLEYYRQELENRRDHLRSAWIWHGPLVLACGILAAVLTGNRRWVSAVPLFVVLALWTGYGVYRRRLAAKDLQREIDEISGA